MTINCPVRIFDHTLVCDPLRWRLYNQIVEIQEQIYLDGNYASESLEILQKSFLVGCVSKGLNNV